MDIIHKMEFDPPITLKQWISLLQVLDDQGIRHRVTPIYRLRTPGGEYFRGSQLTGALFDSEDDALLVKLAWDRNNTLW